MQGREQTKRWKQTESSEQMEVVTESRKDQS